MAMVRVGTGNDCYRDGAGMGMKAMGMGGDGDNVENSSGDGIGMVMTCAGTVRDGEKYLFPCSSLQCSCLLQLESVKQHACCEESDEQVQTSTFHYFNVSLKIHLNIYPITVHAGQTA